MKTRRLLGSMLVLITFAVIAPLCQARTAEDVRLEILNEQIMLKLCAKELADVEFEIAKIKQTMATSRSANTEASGYPAWLASLRRELEKSKACIAARQKKIDGLRKEMERFPTPPSSQLPAHRSVKAKCDEVAAEAAALVARQLKADNDLAAVRAANDKAVTNARKTEGKK